MSEKMMNNNNKTHYDVRVDGVSILKYQFNGIKVELLECDRISLLEKLIFKIFEYSKFHWGQIQYFRKEFLFYLERYIKGNIEIVNMEPPKIWYIKPKDRKLETIQLKFRDSGVGVFMDKIKENKDKLNIKFINDVIKYMNCYGKKYKRQLEYMREFELIIKFYELGEIDEL